MTEEAYVRQSASFRTGVKEILTLLVNSKKGGTAVSYTTFEGQRDRVHASGETHSHGVEDRPPRLNQQSQGLLYTGGEFRRLARTHC